MLIPTDKAINLIKYIRQTRWEAGLRARNRLPEDPFIGEPVAEMFEEVIDALNYLEEGRKASSMPLWAMNTLENNLMQAALILLEFK